jgi:hypothetical protein
VQPTTTTSSRAPGYGGFSCPQQGFVDLLIMFRAL